MLPYMLHYAEDAPYGEGPVMTGDEPYAQTIRYVVLFVDKDTDTRIRPAVRDAHHALVVEQSEAGRHHASR
jgi:hypothetical protein